MRLTIRPLNEPHLEIDVTGPMLAVIADRIADCTGGNRQLNLLEAELHLGRMLREAGRRAPAGLPAEGPK
jgi:hypothetical protein